MPHENKIFEDYFAWPRDLSLSRSPVKQRINASRDVGTGRGAQEVMVGKKDVRASQEDIRLSSPCGAEDAGQSTLYSYSYS